MTRTPVLQNHLTSVVQRRGSDGRNPVLDSTMGRSALSQDEQNTVSLFKARTAPDAPYVQCCDMMLF